MFKFPNPKSLMLFLTLCFIWGSSFVLMKLGMFGRNGQSTLLTPWQLAAWRMLAASAVMLPFAFSFRATWNASQQKPLIVATGLIGTFIPAVLFCLAETGISSALAGTLNASTPLFALVIGITFFRQKSVPTQWWGIILGLLGCILLFAIKGITPPKHIGYALLVVTATVCYGLNTNIAKAKFSHLPALQFSAFALASLFIPALLLAWASGLFKINIAKPEMGLALLSGALLGVLGTALATVLFYALVKRSGVLLASMVTYGIPFVALAWGFAYGEAVNGWQVVALCIILAGVFMAGKKARK